MKIIKVEPYDLELLVFTSARALKMYCKKNSYLIEMDDEEVDLSMCMGLSLSYSDNTLIVLLPKNYDEDTTDHELIHITWYIAKIIGQPLEWNNNEFQTYLFTDLKKKVKKKVYRL